MPLPFFVSLLVQLVIGVALSALGYLLMPKPKMEKGDDVTDMENPTAEAGRPIPVLFGELEITGTNIIWYGDKTNTPREVRV